LLLTGYRLQNYPKILIAAANGAAIGWGCTQLFNFDLVYASTRAVFQTPFTSLGFAPEGGSSYTFPKIMGKHHANRLLIASDKLTAQEMYISGYVSQVLDEKDFVEKVCAISLPVASKNWWRGASGPERRQRACETVEQTRSKSEDVSIFGEKQECFDSWSSQ